MKKIKVAGIQIGIPLGDEEKHQQMILNITEEVMISKQPNLIVFPQDIIISFLPSIESFSNVGALPSLFVKQLSELSTAFNCHIIGSLFKNDNEFEYYTSSFLLSPTRGLINVCKNRYNKDEGKKKNGWGIQSYDNADWLSVFELDNGVKITILLGNEFYNPGTRLRLSQLDTELIVIPTACSLDLENFNEILKEEAVKNNVYILFINCAGFDHLKEKNTTAYYYGNSCLISPEGTIISKLSNESWSHIFSEISIFKALER